jgi:hypothetical protein
VPPIWKVGDVLGPDDLTPNNIAAIKAALTVQQTLALTAWAEARARLFRGKWIVNPPQALLDVMNVITNRAKDHRWSALGVKGVCLQRWAFSCWEPHGGPDDPHDKDDLAENFETLMDRAQRILAGDPLTGQLSDSLALAETMTASPHDDLDKACHYYADWMVQPPKWASAPGVRLTAHRHGHLFLAGVP